MRRLRPGLVIMWIVAVIMPVTAAPAAAEATIVSVSSLRVDPTSISVGGTIAFGADATGPTVLGTDASGDALARAAGLDLTRISVRPNLAGQQLIWNLTVSDGIPDPVGAPGPAGAYMVPIMATGEDGWREDRWRWLAAGHAGTGFPPQPGKWTGLCRNDTGSGGQGGYLCSTVLDGSVTAAGVTWTQPFTQMEPMIQFGSVIESSSIYCGTPCSFAWAVFVTGGIHAVDRIDRMASYKVPGEVELGIAPLGTPPSTVNFSTTGTFNGATGAFSGTVSKPATGGAYTVYAKTCFGLVDALTCFIGTSDVTV